MNDEISQVKERYSRRKLLPMTTYDPLAPSVYKCRQEKETALIRWIDFAGLSPVNDKKLLEIGCGTGGNLHQFIGLGFRPENLVGNELLEDRVMFARSQLPAATKILEGDACSLDLNGTLFDIVFQSTVFTSILDCDFQMKLASKMWSLVKPGGGVLWYDFVYDNPRNPDVKGVTLRRIRELFPEGEIKVWRVVLAPPLNRIVTQIHPSFYSVFNFFPFLRTHVLCWIKKRKTSLPTNLVKIREATKADIFEIARIHKNQFSDHLLGQLSVGLLEKFYTCFLEKGILLVSDCDGIVIGFLLGGNKEQIIGIKNGFIRENLISIAAEVIVRPKHYFSVFHSYRHLVDDGLNSDIPKSMMRLLSIAVLDDFKGAGAAVKLIGEFEKRISSCTDYGLSVKKSNHRAINFYVKNGYVLEKDAGKSLYFIKRLG